MYTLFLHTYTWRHRASGKKINLAIFGIVLPIFPQLNNLLIGKQKVQASSSHVCYVCTNFRISTVFGF